MHVSGVFDLGNKDLNERWVFVPLRTAQTMLDLSGGVSTIEVKIDLIFDADETGATVASRTGLVADSWMRLNQQLLVGLRSQSSSSVMIQFFVVVAVALGIASVLIVSVVQRSREIGIMRTMGTSRGRVIRVFLLQGAILGLVGSALGMALGSVLAIFFRNLASNPDGSPTFPVNLTGGQQQRVAIGRALAMNPPLVLADEPTGNLDTETGDEAFTLLREFNREEGTTFLVVTHDDHIASRCDRGS